MYPFNEKQNEDGSWCLELGGIKLVLDGYYVRDEKHWLKNPRKAIAFFSINGNLYGISNYSRTWHTAEELYDNMHTQLLFFQKEAFPKSFFQLYGFHRRGDEWVYPAGSQIFSYHEEQGWSVNGTPLSEQPEHIAAFLELYANLTGSRLQLTEALA